MRPLPEPLPPDLELDLAYVEEIVDRQDWDFLFEWVGRIFEKAESYAEYLDQSDNRGPRRG
ncbi:MAG: hypothetical protein WD556_13575 [Actinomycetota bacterium]